MPRGMLRDQGSVIAPVPPRGSRAAPGSCQALLVPRGAGSTHQSRAALEPSSGSGGSGSSGFPWIFPPITTISCLSCWACCTISSTTILGQSSVFCSLRSSGEITWRRGLGRSPPPLPAAHPSTLQARVLPPMGFVDAFLITTRSLLALQWVSSSQGLGSAGSGAASAPRGQGWCTSRGRRR